MEMYHKSKRKSGKLPLSPFSNTDEFNLKPYFTSSASFLGTFPAGEGTSRPPLL